MASLAEPDADPEDDLAGFLKAEIDWHSGRGDPLEIVIPGEPRPHPCYQFQPAKPT